MVAPNYPSSVTTVAELVDGLVEILAAENFHKFHIVGGSYGGMLAQCLVRRYPNRVGKLVLDHVSVPRVERVGKYRLYGKVLSLLPLLFIRFLLRLAKKLSLLRLPTQRVFWSSYYDELIAAIVKDDYLSRIQVAIDFDECYTFACDDLLGWPGDILILESDDDALVPLEEREALKLLYPQAQVYTFHGTSHFAWVTRCAELLCVIEDFLGEGR